MVNRIKCQYYIYKHPNQQSNTHLEPFSVANALQILTDDPDYRGTSKLPNLFYLFFASSPNFLIDDEGSRLWCQCPDVTKATNHKPIELACSTHTHQQCVVIVELCWLRPEREATILTKPKNKTDKQLKWIIIYCAHPKCPNIFW